MRISELNVYGEIARVIELSHEEVELYQVKMFYYQSISGIRPFQYSMSQVSSYIYYQKEQGEGVLNLGQWMEKEGSVLNMIRIIEQIVLIIQESSTYLLYPRNFIPSQEEIMVDFNGESLNIQMMYIPICNFDEKDYLNYLIKFISHISRFFNRMNHMEGFYYFVRILEDLKEECSKLEETSGDKPVLEASSKISAERDLLGIFQQFLKNFGSRKHQGSMII